MCIRPAKLFIIADGASITFHTGSDGLLIEVVGVELDDDRLRIIHAMPMRASYRRLHDGDEGEQ